MLTALLVDLPYVAPGPLRQVGNPIFTTSALACPLKSAIVSEATMVETLTVLRIVLFSLNGGTALRRLGYRSKSACQSANRNSNCWKRDDSSWSLIPHP